MALIVRKVEVLYSVHIEIVIIIIVINKLVLLQRKILK